MKPPFLPEITDNLDEQILIGKRLYDSCPEIYTTSVKNSIQSTIDRILGDKDYFEEWGGVGKEDIFYISIYDYWTVGNSVAEELYYNFIGKSYQEKYSFLTLRGRLLYMDYLNSKEDAHLLDNKYEAFQLLADYYKRDIIRICSENDYSAFLDFTATHPEFVVKPEGAGLSVGVHLSRLSDYPNPETAFHMILNEGAFYQKEYNWIHSSGIVLEEIINQNEQLSVLHPASINSVRCTTIRTGNTFQVFYPFIRIGVDGGFIASCATGGITASIDPYTGIVNSIGRTETRRVYLTHPNTGIGIQGFQIPDWEEMLKIVFDAASRFDSIRYIGWDMVYSTKGWCIMEGNYAGEFAAQIPLQRGFRKELEDLIGWKPDKKLWWE